MGRPIAVLLVLMLVLVLTPAITAEEQQKTKSGEPGTGKKTVSFSCVVESVEGGDPIRFTVRLLEASPEIRGLQRGGRLIVVVHPEAMRRIQSKKATFDLKPGDRVLLGGVIRDRVFLAMEASRIVAP